MNRRRLGQLLRVAVRTPGRAPPAPLARALAGPDAAALATLADYHRVAGFLHRTVAAVESSHPELVTRLRAAHAEAVRRHLRAVADLGCVGEALRGAGIPWLVFKGPVLAETVYPDIDLRTYRDLDVLVPGDRLAQAVAALEGAGAGLTDRNWELFLARRTGALHLLLPYGTVCDLHWDVLHDRWQRAAFAVPGGDLLQRARTVGIGGMQVPTLDPEDTLHHLMVHACLSGAERLVWLKDVELAIRRLRPDWDVVVARCREARTGLPAAVVLSRARRILGAPVPGEVLATLDPSPTWTRLVACSDRLIPPERVSRRGSLPRLVARATGPDLPSSALGLVSRAGSWLSGAVRPGGPRARQGEASHPGSGRHPSGGEAGRAAFMEAVARAGRPSGHLTGARPAGGPRQRPGSATRRGLPDSVPNARDRQDRCP